MNWLTCSAWLPSNNRKPLLTGSKQQHEVSCPEICLRHVKNISMEIAVKCIENNDSKKHDWLTLTQKPVTRSHQPALKDRSLKTLWHGLYTFSCTSDNSGKINNCNLMEYTNNSPSLSCLPENLITMLQLITLKDTPTYFSLRALIILQWLQC